MLSAELRLVYERSVYEAELDSGSVSFRVMQESEDDLLHETLAIITAWNPAELHPERAVNERANAKLAEEIRLRGWKPYTARGRSVDGSHVEPSFAVLNIARDEALELGRHYAQAAIFYWDGSEAAILSCND